VFKYFLVIVAAILAAACSNTPLDGPVVSERAATSPAKTASAQSSVAPVQAQSTPADAIGPMNTNRTVYFDLDSYAIRPEFRPLLETHARYLRVNTSRKVVIGGHTDERGSREYNLALSQQRSESLRRALALLGVSNQQVEAIGFGEEKPVAAGSDETAWAKNRRAEIAYQ
jgi:peptidoglycan-associated lipoprotein